ncbi:MAG: acetylxylan esterase [Bacteroidales bacterium]|nr:acetylxylan esterase [Bacteroidales bacterium]
MKQFILLIFISFFISLNSFSQNLIPYKWKTISVENYDFHDTIAFNVSWERQGLCNLAGNTILENNFIIPKKLYKKISTNNLKLTIDVKSKIDSLVLNGVKIVENVKSAIVDVSPKNILVNNNNIKLYAKDFEYTGGKCKNIIKLEPSNSTAEVNIFIEPKDHLFTTSTPQFDIKWISDYNQFLEIEVYNEFCKKVYSENRKIKAGEETSTIELNGLKPGFYECRIYLKGQDNAECVEWIAYQPEKISCQKTINDNYYEFWQQSISELDLIEPYYQIKKVDSLCVGLRDGYIVEFQSLDNIPIYSYLFLPKNNKPCPVILHVPGYGYGFEDVMKYSNKNQDIAEMFLCVRGHGLSKNYFNPEKTDCGIWGHEIFDLKNNSYRGIYMDCVRAVDFIVQDYHFDNSKIAVMGGSQGGGLALATASLCKANISVCGYFDPFICDVNHFLECRKMCKVEINNFLKYYNNSHTYDEAIEVQKMIDVLDMSRQIECSTLFVTSLFDDDCPPHVGFSAYNQLKGEKQFIIYPNKGHIDTNYYDDMIKYIRNKFGL